MREQAIAILHGRRNPRVMAAILRERNNSNIVRAGAHVAAQPSRPPNPPANGEVASQLGKRAYSARHLPERRPCDCVAT